MNRLRVSLVLAVALAALPSGAEAFALRGSVVSGGGTPATGISNASHRTYATVGQPVVGVSASAVRTLCHGFWCFGGSCVVSVEPPRGGPDLPAELAFGVPRPNPARDRVSFELALPRPADVNLGLFDLQGRRVLTMVDGHMEAGYHVVRWDGSQGSGGAAGSGMYFARLLVDGRPQGQRRIVMLR